MPRKRLRSRSQKTRRWTAGRAAAHLELNDALEAEMWQLIREHYGVSPLPGCRLLQSGQHRIRVISQEACNLLSQIPRVEVAGLYLGEHRPNGIRLSLDAAQLIGSQATKQVLVLTAEQAAAWLRGESIDVESDQSGYVIVTHKSDTLGGGSLSGNRLHNFLPKDRRPQKQ